MKSAAERLLATAAAEVGYLEKKSRAQLDDKTANAGSANFTRYARDLDELGDFYNGPKQGYAWCDVFVDWCFVKTFGEAAALALTCQPRGSCGAGVNFSAGYYKAKGQFHTSGPQPGDQIFFVRRGANNTISSWQHTGLVEAVEDGYVRTIEGNTSGASGVVANGGGVCRKRYKLSDPSIGGYGRPDYSLVEEDEPMTEQRVRELTREELEAAQQPVFRRLEDVPDYWREDIAWLTQQRYLLGDEHGELNLDHDTARVFVVLARVARAQGMGK